MPKAYSANLLDAVSSTYNQNQTTLLGRANVKTLLNGKQAIGPYLPKFVDVFTDTSGAVNFSSSAPLTYCSPNQRLYFVNIAGTGLANVVLYNFNTSTGAASYVGRLQVSIPASGTNTPRSLTVANDAGTTNYKIIIGIVNSANASYSGLYMATCNLADFQPSGGVLIPFAVEPNPDRSVQHLVDNQNSSIQTLTANWGSFNDGNKIWGMTVPTSSTTRWYRFDHTNAQTQNPILITNWQNRGASGHIINAAAHGWIVNDHVTAIPPRISSIATGTTTTFTTSTPHGFQADERVQVFHATGAATLPTGLNVGTNYFVRSTGLTATQFELSTTVGGASISTSGSLVGQAFVGLFPVGHTSAANQYYVSTNNLTANTFQYSTAISSAGITAVNNTIISIAGTVITASAATTALVVGSRVRFWSTGTFPTGISADTDYWVVARSGSTFQVATSPAGPAISPGPGFTGTFTVGLAPTGNFYAYNSLGETVELFDYSTNQIPGFTGTGNTNCVDTATPNHTVNSGQSCVFFSSTTSLFLGKISELTAGASTWPSLLVKDNLPNIANNTVTPVTAFSNWSQVLDRAVLAQNTTSGPSRFIIKRIVNTESDFNFGVAQNRALEAGVAATAIDGEEVGGVTTSNSEVINGWLILPITATKQRGAIVADLKADPFFDEIDASLTPSDGFISKVITVPPGSFVAAHVQRQLPGETNRPRLQYRTSGFGSPTGGWIDLPSDNDMSLVPSATQIQFKCLFPLFESSHARAAQVSEIIVVVQPSNENSDNWEISDEFSDNNAPSRIAFRLKEAYAVSVPQLFFRARDLSDVLLISHNTVANAANFEYSTDNGVSWLPLGTIPNTVGTLIRYTFTSPPGVDIRPSIRES